MLAKSLPDDREIIGIDLAEGMVDLANARCAEAGIRSVLTQPCAVSGTCLADVAFLCCVFSIELI